MIAISTPTYDLDGAMVFDGSDRTTDLNNRYGDRRLARTATLDGGCVFTDNGYSDSDRSILIDVPLATDAEIDFARYIVETYSLVNVAAEDGFYQAAPSGYVVSGGVLSMTLLVSEKLSE